MRIFITGGAGFIGRRLCTLLKVDHEVTVYDNFLPQVHGADAAPSPMLEGVHVIRGDVRDAAALAAAFREARPERVYHLASETGTGQSYDEPTRYNMVNIMGTSHLIDAVRAQAGVSRVLVAGSRSVYGEGACVDARGNHVLARARTAADMAKGIFTPRAATDELLTPVATRAAICPVSPASIYASTKLLQEYMLAQAFWGTDVEVGILRLQNVYGPGQSLSNPYTGVISIFRKQIEEESILNIYEDGAIVRDFVYVDDVARAFALIGLAQKCPREVLDIGSGEPTQIIDMARMLLAMMGQPKDKLRVTGQFRAGDVRYAVADISDTIRHLDWRPQVTLEAGMSKFLEWSGE
ncbi:dTDP-L-rhamnose 4-epimerase [Mesorhizobium loti]|uniref:dTDP-L-rhamnose 4-epimerase n=1 Tax=Rhizobium loti TaxID=381 RepID=A0A8E2WEF6_RHILI|nr:NAD-dependent epimerase/dehydratase family protein [Mesorhizobium loti]PWJ92744.1 dTDP-L-rhamnose 4-epimerase [Mesorhizobium loti]